MAGPVRIKQGTRMACTETGSGPAAQQYEGVLGLLLYINTHVPSGASRTSGCLGVKAGSMRPRPTNLRGGECMEGVVWGAVHRLMPNPGCRH